MSVKLGILTGFDKEHLHYIRACEELGVNHEVVDVLSTDWVDLVQKSGCDGFLVRPPCNFQERNSIYMERLYFINKILEKPIYPSYEELFLYENKRAAIAWLEINGYPYPETKIFVRKEEALEHVATAGLPLVFKSNIGAASSGVDIVKSQKEAVRIINHIFGIRPLRAEGYHKRRCKCKHIPVFLSSIPAPGLLQKHYVIIQEYLKIKFEWRIIKVDNSYFGHQKLFKGEFISGSHRTGWFKPPEKLLYLTKEICEKGGFYSMAIDFLTTPDDQFYIGEMHSLFGSTELSQMRINDVPGRFCYQDNRFIFQEGVFNQHASYLLRVAHFLKLLKERNR